MFFSDDMKALVRLFQKHNVSFAVCGGFAVAHYGFVRATMDFDLLVLPSTENAEKIMASLTEFGFGNAGIAQAVFEKSGTAITLGAQPNQIDLMTSMSDQPTAVIISNAVDMYFKGVRMKVVAFEDLLHAKKYAGRAKDRIDYEELTKIGPGKKGG